MCSLTLLEKQGKINRFPNEDCMNTIASRKKLSLAEKNARRMAQHERFLKEGYSQAKKAELEENRKLLSNF